MSLTKPLNINNVNKMGGAQGKESYCSTENVYKLLNELFKEFLNEECCIHLLSIKIIQNAIFNLPVLCAHFALLFM